MRADRLVAITLLLQTHGQMTAADLAERLETSERTIRRDLDSLSAAGVPVYAQRGRGGGWALLGGHKLNLSGLTADEAQALFLVAGPEALAGLAAEPAVRSALRKLMAALPAPFREQATAARQAVHVDPVAWGRKPQERPGHLDALREAVIAGVQVDIIYAKPREDPATRRVHPFGLVAKGGTWYLIAGTLAGLRTFRVSRVHAVTPTDEVVERPEDFDLARAWDTVVERFPHHNHDQDMAVVIEGDAVVVRQIGRAFESWSATSVEDADDGQRRITVMFPQEPAMAAARLVEFASRARVVSPPEVCAELARIGEALLTRYTVKTPASRPPSGSDGSRR